MDTSASRIEVLDGFVELVDHMGSDLTVVNAARVSFGKAKSKLDESDRKLIHFLVAHKHNSPLRHVQFQFRLEDLSEVVCRQLYKHQVGCGYTGSEFREVASVWNEVSGRYVEFEPKFHIPSKFRKQHKSNKQASLEDDLVMGEEVSEIFQASVAQSYRAYKQLLDAGVCKEQARMVLPVCFKNSLIWTASLEAVAHFIKLRDHEGAQLEIRELARAIRTLIAPIVPISLEALEV